MAVVGNGHQLCVMLGRQVLPCWRLAPLASARIHPQLQSLCALVHMPPAQLLGAVAEGEMHQLQPCSGLDACAGMPLHKGVSR